MFRPKLENKEINLEGMQFKFTDNYIGSVYFKEATFDAYSLATLMYGRPNNLLQQIRSGMKIINNQRLYDMDDSTFNALLEYGNTLCQNKFKNK